MPKSEMTPRRAAWIGWVWVTGSVLAAYVVALGLLIWFLNTQAALVDQLGPWTLLLVACALVGPWLIWSIQVTRWRLWAYRQVRDLNALKAEAVALSVIWPSGHFFEKTEIRSRSQKLELERYEQAATSV